MSTTEAAPFRSAHSALRWANGVAGQGEYQRPVTARIEECEPDVRHTPRFPDLSPIEKHAQAAWIINAATQNSALTPLEQLLVTAYFTMPNTPLQLETKEVAIERVAAVMTGYYSYGPSFIQDAVRRFAGTAHRNNAEWATDLGKSKRAVRDCRQGVIRRLHKIMDSAMDKLDVALEERGYVAA